MGKIYETYRKIYQEIIPNTPYTPIKNIILHFEKYDYRSIGIEIIQLLKFGYLFKIKNNFISIHTKQLVLGLTAFSYLKSDWSDEMNDILRICRQSRL